MPLSSLLTSSVITGFVFVIITSIALAFYFSSFYKRIWKMKKIWPENKFVNTKWINFFKFYMFYSFIIFFIFMTVFFTCCLVFSEIKILSKLFTLFYLIYTIQIFTIIILLNNKQNSLVAFQYEDKLVLYNEVIELNKIVEISHNLKRTTIFITFKDDNDLEDIIRLNYNWKLFDYLKALNLKINF
ncbi:hypothetical protein SBIUS_v1c04870 [Spiroplasma sp. BIUS-1]|nr:hypothetical protein SBIUS_v1c04870 [Spiroplasma sp. BIUS-1]